MSNFTNRYIRTITHAISESGRAETLYTVPSNRTFIAFHKNINSSSSLQQGDPVLFYESEGSNVLSYEAFTEMVVTVFSLQDGDYVLELTDNGLGFYNWIGIGDDGVVRFGTTLQEYGIYPLYKNTVDFSTNPYYSAEKNKYSSSPCISFFAGPRNWHITTPNWGSDYAYSPSDMGTHNDDLSTLTWSKSGIKIYRFDNLFARLYDIYTTKALSSSTASNNIISILEGINRENIKERYEAGMNILVSGGTGTTASITGILYDENMAPIQREDYVEE